MSERAIELIRKEKKEKTGKLNLAYCGLEELPHELFELSHLKYLDLSFNYISDCRQLKELTQLNILDLSRNDISNYDFLADLTSLTTLSLRHNHISNFHYFGKLHHLIELDLSNTRKNEQIYDLQPLERLTALTTLDLSNNEFSSYRFLEGIPSLTSLSLRSNQIIDFSFLKSFPKLSALDIRDNQITDIKFLEEIPNLVSLNLSNNKIVDTSSLSSLAKLQSLDLSNNELKNFIIPRNLPALVYLSLRDNNIPDISFLKKLQNLISLDISKNLIKDFSVLEHLSLLTSLTVSANWWEIDFSTIGNLTSLKSLDLSSNRIRELKFLEKLISLISLNLRSNWIENGEALRKLISLEVLDLSFNIISKIGFLENLTSTTSIYLKGNLISDIQPLKQLSYLRYLDLGNNRIEDVLPICNLKQIEAINLNYNKIEKIPKEIVYLSPKLTTKDYSYKNGYISFYSNPISSPPLEILKKGDFEVIQYLEDIANQGKDYLYEAKLLIVGEGESGKTTLAWKLKDLNAPMPEKEHDRTSGIDIQALEIENIHLKDKLFRMNAWDFGGQEIYHATHQFFLTKRSLYIIVNNTRSNLTDFNHWLQMINLFSDKSPVIIVQNEVAGSPTELDLRGLQQHFDNVLFVRDADLSKKDYRLKNLIRDIHYQIQRLDHVGSELPKQWVAIRNEVKKRAEEEPYISDKEYKKICQENKITDKDAMRRLGGFLHDLGVFLHFQDDPILKRTVILRNSWATKGVYEILDSKEVRKRKGHFSYEEAQKIWKGTNFEDMHDELLQLMSKFELCYRIPYKQPVQYVSPQLLPVEKPNYSWARENNLIIYYEYEFMPKGLMGRLIVRLHRYIKDINNMAWRSGCVFTYEHADAQVVETYGAKKIEVRVRGPHCITLSSIIIKEIDELNAGFEQLKVEKMIPCNCQECKRSSTPHFFKYKDLLLRRKKNKPTIECVLSFEDVSVQALVDGVFEEQAAKLERSIPNLIKAGKIKEALDEFELEHPDEAIILLGQYNKGLNDYHLKVITKEAWEVELQRIGKAILEMSKNQ